jgi:hypothetical protein
MSVTVDGPAFRLAAVRPIKKVHDPVQLSQYPKPTGFGAAY